MDPAVRVMPLRIEQPAEGVLHCTRRRRVDMALDGRKVDDVFPLEILRDRDPLRIDRVENMHLRLRRVMNPADVAFSEIVEHRNVIAAEYGDVIIKILPFEGVRHHRLVLHADKFRESRVPQGENGSLHLPGRRIGGGERKMPRNIILQDCRDTLGEGLFHAGEMRELLDVFQDGLGAGLDDGDGRFRHRVISRR